MALPGGLLATRLAQPKETKPRIRQYRRAGLEVSNGPIKRLIKDTVPCKKRRIRQAASIYIAGVFEEIIYQLLQNAMDEEESLAAKARVKDRSNLTIRDKTILQILTENGGTFEKFMRQQGFLVRKGKGDRAKRDKIRGKRRSTKKAGTAKAAAVPKTKATPSATRGKALGV